MIKTKNNLTVKSLLSKGNLIGRIRAGSLIDPKVKAVKDMTVLIEDDELIFDYDNVLNVEFSVVGNDLIIDDNEPFIDFNINKNGELEVTY